MNELSCRKCGVALTDENWTASSQRNRQHICGPCRAKISAAYRKRLGIEYNKRQLKYYHAHQKDKRVQRVRERKYGLSEFVFQALLTLQNHKCKICGVFMDNLSRATKICIDHDHATGKVRGLLCPLCNVGLGAFKDNKELLEKALIYLNQ